MTEFVPVKPPKLTKQYAQRVTPPWVKAKERQATKAKATVEERKTRQQIIDEYNAKRLPVPAGDHAEGGAPPPSVVEDLETTPAAVFDPVAEAARLAKLDLAQVVGLDEQPKPAPRLTVHRDLAPPQRIGRGQPVPAKPILQDPKSDYVLIELPGGGRARVRREDIQVDPDFEAVGEDHPNFRCMVTNTMIPTGHPDFYCSPSRREVGTIVCPTCHSKTVIQLRNEQGEWIAPFQPGQSVVA